MSQDKQSALNNSTARKLAGCFVSSFSKEHGHHQKRVNSGDKLKASQLQKPITQAAQTPSQSSSVDQTEMLKCNLLIMGDFTQSSQRKELYLSAIDWQKLPGARAPKFYSEKKADYHLTIHDICECDKNSYNVVLSSSTYIVLIPSSAQDLAFSCRAVFDKQQLLSAECKVVYLNLAARNSQEHLAIEAIANKWKNKGFNFSSVDAASVDLLIKNAVEHTYAVYQKLSDRNYSESQDNRGCSLKVNGF